MKQNSFTLAFRDIATIFKPPFNGLWLVMLIYYAWCFIVYPHGPTLRGDLPDTDDYMYLNQVLDWMKGQSWFDNIQHRLDPPAGVPIQFSRLAQIPMAAMIGLFELCGLGPRGAATLMALIYPLILLGIFFTVLRWLAASFMPKEWAGVTAYVALFSTGLMFMFRPGHVDHHGLIVVLVAFALASALRMIERPEQFRWGLYAGLALAVGQTIALEILPWLLLISGTLGLWAIVKGNNAARNGFVYGLALVIGSLICLLLTRPPGDLLTIDVLTYSVVYVLLTAGVAVTFAGIILAARSPSWVRFVVALVLATSTGGWFLHSFPELVSGPYGGIDPNLAQIILGEMVEAQPFKTDHTTWFAVSEVMAGSLLAMGAAFWYLVHSRRDDLWRWGFLVLLLVASFALTMFYQRRFVAIMGMLTIIPLSVLLQRGWVWVGERWRGRGRVYAEIGLLLLVGPSAIIYPAILDGRSFNTGMLLFPAATSNSEKCELYKLENILRDKAFFGDRPRLIMSTIGAGPEILFRTDHSVLSAPYHMDVMGNVDATRFFSTLYPEEAEAIIRRRHVDLVVACRAIPEAYVRVTLSKAFPEGQDLPDIAPHFIERLMDGRVPHWLKRVRIPGLDNFVVYSVRPETAASPLTSEAPETPATSLSK